MTVERLIYDVREQLKQYTDDSELSDSYIIHLFNIKRSRLLRQEMNNYQRTSDTSALQTLCLGLEEVNINQCDLDLDCETILRTKQPIPKPLDLHIKTAITEVKPTKRLTIPFNFISKQKAVYYENSPFKHGIFAFLDNDYHIYLVSGVRDLGMLECITVTGVFENPLDLLNYSNCCDCDFAPCFDLDTIDYPIQPHYIDVIRAEIIKDLAAQKFMNEDKNNDSNTDNYDNNK